MTKTRSRLSRLVLLLSRAYVAVAAGLAGWLVLSVTAAVIGRYYYGRPLAWTLEVAEYSLLFITFLGLTAVAWDEGHVRVELVSEDNAPRLTRVADLVGDVVGLALSSVLAAAAWWVTVDSYVAGVRMSRILPIQRWVILVAVPIGLTLLALFHVAKLASRVGDWRARR